MIKLKGSFEIVAHYYKRVLEKRRILVIVLVIPNKLFIFFSKMIQEMFILLFGA